MKDRKPFDLKYLVVLHNWFLSVGSLFVFLKLFQHSWAVYQRENGFEKLFCNSSGDLNSNIRNDGFWLSSPKLESNMLFWLQVFFISKFYELLDTVFLTLRKKPVIFLHWYHHITTLLVLWYSMGSDLSTNCFCAVFNTFIHVFMYFYYMCQTLKIHIWWKRYLTQLQILQFLTVLTAAMMWVYFTVAQHRSCSGNWVSFSMGFSILVSFLGLFIQFYQLTYKKVNHNTHNTNNNNKDNVQLAKKTE
eukprot:Sdes_comp19761_c0_seq1m11805